MTFKVPNKYRVRGGLMATTDEIGNCGAFDIKLKHSQRVFVIASDGLQWEHVSVSRRDRCPTWDEMCQVKAIFWDDEDCVMQLHPPKSDWVNNHSFCLHLWRPLDAEIPLPPSMMVGFKDAGVLV